MIHSELLTQTFRSRLSGVTIDIPVQTPATAGPFVLLSDIQSVFKGAESIQRGRLLVPFLKDENLEQIKPLRIAYHPGVELDVIVSTRDKAAPTGVVAGPGEEIACGSAAETSRATPTDEAAMIADTNQSLRHIMKDYKEKLQEAINKNSTLQQRLLQVQSQQQQTSKEFARDPEAMKDMQREALGSLITVHNCAQAVLTQSYELHDYPFPRLFIILPKTQDVLRHDNFRLYFLCECGTFTMPEGTKTQHEVHLAKHEGYELDKPVEFIGKYGSYLITMLQMVLFGILSTGSIVQPVTNNIVGDRNVLKNALKFLEDSQQNISSAELPFRQTDVDKLQVLDGADMREIWSYLKTKDGEYALGHLSRIVTPEGDPKWVCSDCLNLFRGHYRESAIQQLQDIVVANGGRFTEEISRIEVRLRSNVQAREFYTMLSRAGGIQELDISLTWDATMDDLKALASAVSSASVIDLTVDGSHFKGASDIINRRRRFNPIMQLASNERIKYLRLRGFEEFFHRVNRIGLPSWPREFSMESGNILNRKAVKSFNRFLEYRPPLTTLTLRLKVKYSLEKTTTDILSRLATLQSLTINRGELTVTTNIMEDKTRDVDLTIERVDNILSDDVTFIKHDQLTRLAIKFTPQETDESQLISILRRKPRLMHLQLGSEASRALAIVNLVISAREEILREGEASGLHTFELMEEKLIPFDENGDRDESSHIQTHVSFTDDSFDMRTWIRLEDRACLTENHPLHGFVRQYGWSIDFMEEDWAHHSAFAAIFDEIPGTRGFMLETLSLEVSGFTTLDFERLDLIIQQSPNFKQLGLCIKPARMDLSEIACRMLKRYGPRLFKLHLHGVFSAQWLQKFASFFPSRASFPNLRCFEVSFETGCEVSDDCVRWITELISAPSQVSASSSSAQTLLQCNFEQSIPWKRVRKIMLPHIDLKPEQWKVFIDAIDFTELQHLDLRDSNLRPDGFNQLVNRIPGFKAPLRTLSLEHTDIGTSSRKLKSVIADLREKVPEAKILTTTSKLRPMLALRWKQS